ncbi:MAG: YihY/virulence factor BrkB family protein [Tetrasphaera sp.]
MGVVDWVDRQQRRHAVLGFPIAVIYKFFDDAGGYLAALLAYYAFVSMFPLLLLLATILSIVLRNDPELQERIISSALAQFPVIGDQLGDPRSLSGGTAGVVVGVAVALYGGLGVGNALQYAMNTIWGVERNSRPNPIKVRVRSLFLVFTAGLAVSATTVISALGSAYSGWGELTKVGVLLATFVMNTGIFLLAFRIGSGRARKRHQLPGAIVAAVFWHLLQTYGLVYVARVIRRASASNGVVAFVIGLLAFLYLAAVVVVVCAELNVVSARGLYPRALLTPFTDNVHLTDADIRSYSIQARAMRTKMYEVIDVTFHASEEAAREAQAGGATAVDADDPPAPVPEPGTVGSGSTGRRD